MKPTQHTPCQRHIKVGDLDYTAEQINQLLSLIPYKADRKEISALISFTGQNYIGHYPSATLLKPQDRFAWALVGSLSAAAPYFFYTAGNEPEGYTAGWNNMQPVFGTYDLAQEDKEDEITSEDFMRIPLHLPLLTADRAIADEHGNRIADTYETRQAVRNHIRAVYNEQFNENPPLIMEEYITPNMLSQDVKDMLSQAGATINNVPDGEDLTTKQGVLKLSDKPYNPGAYSGLGRVYLRKNLVGGQNLLTQTMVSKPNTIYILQYDYTLDGKSITIPEGCVLDFQGGSLSNGKLLGECFSVNGEKGFIIDNLSFDKHFFKHIDSKWFVFENIDELINKINSEDAFLNISYGEYKINNTANVKNVIRFNNSKLVVNGNFDAFNMYPKGAIFDALIEVVAEDYGKSVILFDNTLSEYGWETKKNNTGNTLENIVITNNNNYIESSCAIQIYSRRTDRVGYISWVKAHNVYINKGFYRGIYIHSDEGSWASGNIFDTIVVNKTVIPIEDLSSNIFNNVLTQANSDGTPNKALVLGDNFNGRVWDGNTVTLKNGIYNLYGLSPYFVNKVGRNSIVNTANATKQGLYKTVYGFKTNSTTWDRSALTAGTLSFIDEFHGGKIDNRWILGYNREEGGRRIHEIPYITGFSTQLPDGQILSGAVLRATTEINNTYSFMKLNDYPLTAKLNPEILTTIWLDPSYTYNFYQGLYKDENNYILFHLDRKEIDGGVKVGHLLLSNNGNKKDYPIPLSSLMSNCSIKIWIKVNIESVYCAFCIDYQAGSIVDTTKMFEVIGYNDSLIASFETPQTDKSYIPNNIILSPYIKTVSNGKIADLHLVSFEVVSNRVLSNDLNC